MQERNKIIDVYRALAILMITLFHVTRVTGIEETSILNFFLKGWIGVGLFFVISGYCISFVVAKTFDNEITFNNYRKYLINRWLRLAIPYYIAIFVWYILINYFNVAIKPTGTKDILYHIFFIHNLSNSTFFSISGVFWIMANQMQFYFIFPFIFFIGKKIPPILIIIFFLFISILFSHIGQTERMLWGTIPSLFCFLLGWGIYVYKNKIAALKYKKPIYIIFIALFIYMFFISDYGFDSHKRYFEYFMSFCAAVLLSIGISTPINSNIIINLISYIGKTSFSIYLYNYIFFVFAYCHFNLTNNLYLNIFCLTLFVLIIGTIMYYLIERNAELIRKKLM